MRADAATRMAGPAAADTVGRIVKAATPVPVISDVTGWAVAEALKALAVYLHSVWQYPEHCQALVQLLQDERLLKTVEALDLLTDLDEYRAWRGSEYAELCGVLDDALWHLSSAGVVPCTTDGKLLATGAPDVRASQHAEHKETRARRIMHKLSLRTATHSVAVGDAPSQGVHARAVVRVTQAPHLEATCNKLQQMCTLQEYQRWQATLSEHRRAAQAAMGAAAPPRPVRLQSLQQRLDAPARLSTVFRYQHRLADSTQQLLQTTRNVALCGMGGIGKTHVARAVKLPGRIRVELTAGRSPNFYTLLASAFHQTFGAQTSVPFVDAATGLQTMCSLVKEAGKPVLLVLDDVWPDERAGVVASLNFTTLPGRCLQDSRLLITTRSQQVLSYAPNAQPFVQMPELAIVPVPPLSRTQARQLLCSSAAYAPKVIADDMLDALVRETGYVPLAAKVLGGRLSCCAQAQDWQGLVHDVAQRGCSIAEQQVHAVCASSYAQLPPSLQQCFRCFAAYPEDTELAEQEIVSAFSAHAPLGGASARHAAAAKLRDLVQRSLVHCKDMGAQASLYSMHDLLRDIAVHEAHTAAELCVIDHSYSATDARGTSAQGTLVRAVQCAWSSRGPPLLADARLLMATEVVFGSEAVGRSHAPQSKRLRFVSMRACKMASLHTEHLCSLRALIVERADIESLPSELGKCRLLELLVLRQLPQLAALPDSIGGCHQLLDLAVDRCGALQTLSDSLGQCRQLTWLDVRRCDSLCALSDGIGGCQALARLRIGDCPVLQMLPDSLGRCRSLTQLSILTCRRLQSLPDSICGCSSLAELTVGGCDALQALPGSLRECCQLQTIDIRCKRVEAIPGFQTCGGSNQLRKLTIKNCGALKGLPKTMQLCKQLTELTLYNNNALQALPEAIGSCVQLQALRLQRCASLCGIPDSIGGCKQLTEMFVDVCHHVRALPLAIGHCTALKSLRLERCAALMGVPETITGCCELTQLSVRSCSTPPAQALQGGPLWDLPRAISACSKLQELHRFEIALQTLPDCGDALQQLTELHVSMSFQLQVLPSSLSQCSALQKLHVQGTIALQALPACIGECPQLTELQLQKCVALSTLPQSLTTCTSLQRILLIGCRALHTISTFARCTQLQQVVVCGCPALSEQAVEASFPHVTAAQGIAYIDAPVKESDNAWAAYKQSQWSAEERQDLQHHLRVLRDAWPLWLQGGQ